MTQTKTGARLRPILFSTEMVQAILEGRKTQTRRVVKARSYIADVVDGIPYEMTYDDLQPIRCPYGEPGDVIWVRETWAAYGAFGNYGRIEYKADSGKKRSSCALPWKPSIHMPFAAARIFLRVKSVRVERLQDITCQDVLSEGMESGHDPSFKNLWQSINGPESWEANPWVWVVEFERISREEAIQ